MRVGYKWLKRIQVTGKKIPKYFFIYFYETLAKHKKQDLGFIQLKKGFNNIITARIKTGKCYEQFFPIILFFYLTIVKGSREL